MDTEKDAMSVAQRRGRREKVDKSGKLSALQKLKMARETGCKHQQQLEESSVYEEVDENEYSRIVHERQNDDWIVDDSTDGTGYIEDGREIFDDDLYDTDRKPTKRPRHADAPRDGVTAKRSNIKSLFAAVTNSNKTTKKNKKSETTTLDGDTLLNSLVEELGDGDDDDVILPTPVRVRKEVSEKRSREKKGVSSSNHNNNNINNNVNNKNKNVDNNKNIITTNNKHCSFTNNRSKAASIPNVRKDDGKDKEEDEEEEEENGEKGTVTMRDDAIKNKTKNVNNNNHNHDRNNKVMSTRVNMKKKKNEDDDDDGGSGSGGDDDDVDSAGIVSDEAKFGGEKEEEEEEEMANLMDGRQMDNLPVIDDGGVDEDFNVFGGGDNDVGVNTDNNNNDNNGGGGPLNFYWLDAYEDYTKKPGSVYLFGKTWSEKEKKHVSCCIIVKEIWRRVFLLPRDKRLGEGGEEGGDVTFVDVYNEFRDVISVRYNIPNFKSKKSTKLYAFEKEGVPLEAQYLEVIYPAEYQQLPTDLHGETFSCTFGTTTPSLEQLLVHRRLKGPSWLAISNYAISHPPVSWCSMEVSIRGIKDIQPLPQPQHHPPLVVMVINLITYNNPFDHKNEILGVCLLVNNKFSFDKRNSSNCFQQHFSAICKLHDCVFPFDLKDKLKEKLRGMSVELVANEKSLLNLIIAKLHKIDPDVIMGHDVTSFDLDLLLHRLHVHKAPNWSRIGRLNRKQPAVKPGTFGSKSIMGSCAGRLVCDIKVSAMELVRCRSYDMDELSRHVLKRGREGKGEVVDLAALFSSSKQLAQVVHASVVDATLVSQISSELNILPLAHQITTICGNLMSRTLVGGRSERNEYLLLHAFHDKNFIVPDKVFKKKGEDGGKKKADYAGGLVLEPKKGFYDQFILLLDFNSLYPSIIQEYNICFTTIDFNNNTNKNNNDNDATNTINTTINTPNKRHRTTTTTVSSDVTFDYDESLLPQEGLSPGVLPTEIRKLVESRRQVKTLMKHLPVTSDQYVQYDIRQKALKLTANSMYGCLGFGMSRFYAKKIAALITGKGREILLKTKELVESMNIEVIYGDTDSLMINTRLQNYNDVISLGNKIKSEVNRLYRLLEIDIDGVYKSLLLLKKKKYAGCVVTRAGGDGALVEMREMKGLDIVRRDWCPLAQQTGSGVLDDIFSGEGNEGVVERVHERLFGVAQKARQGVLPRSLFCITKQLNKSPEEYKEKEGLPHVQVAQRLNSTAARKLKAGDVVYYVVCLNGTTDPATKRAYHPDEMNKDESLTIDIDYYLSQQVHPVVSRLVDCIDGTDAYRIADCLGLDAKSYRPAPVHVEEGGGMGGRHRSYKERFSDCCKFSYTCVSCGTENNIDSPYVPLDETSERVQASLATCLNPSCSSPIINHPNTLKNLLTLQLRGHMRKYHEGWLLCDDVACGHRSRKVPLLLSFKHPVCPECLKGTLKMEFSDKHLYTQLFFLSNVFDLDHPAFQGKAKVGLSEERRQVMNELKKLVDDKLQSSSYATVELSKIFACLMPKKSGAGW